MKVAIIMGSNSDYVIMKKAEEILKDFQVEYEIKVVSAHRTPQKMFDFALNAFNKGFKVIIAGAGGDKILSTFIMMIMTYIGSLE